MITRLQAKNYKSLKNLDLELRQFNVLLGPNAAGKSNIIDALAFLQEMTNVTDWRTSLNHRGGFERVGFGGRESDITISISFQHPDLGVPAQYTIVFNKDRIEAERISGEEPLRAVPRQNITNVPSLERRADGSVVGEVSPGSLVLNPQTTALYWTGYNPSWSVSYPVYKLVNSFTVYQFSPQEIRKALEVKGEVALDRSGANLARVLHTLRNQHEEVFEKIELLLRQAIREAERLRTPMTIGRSDTSIGLQEETLEADFHQLSDGTLQILALITAVSLPHPQLVCIEEPENFIHARLQQFLVEVFKNSGKQIILTTHSPYLIDFIDPDDVIVVEKDKGETKASRLEEPKELKKRLKELELGLGEYYFSGALGGTP